MQFDNRKLLKAILRVFYVKEIIEVEMACFGVELFLLMLCLPLIEIGPHVLLIDRGNPISK